MSRPAVAHIRLDAFRHNYRLAKKMHGGRALAVIKANAYGHGAVQCALAIADEADGYAVAAIEEALSLRAAGITAPILLLEGFFEAAELPEIVAHNLWVVIHHLWQVEALMAAQLRTPLTVWLKMDSDMHRVGLATDEYRRVYERLQGHPNVADIILMSHFARADELDSCYTSRQIHTFHTAIAGINASISLSNSAAVLGWPDAYADWARPGIMLYGANPIAGQEGQLNMPLRPVMQLTSAVISVRTVSMGEAVGYGGVFVADRTTRVGVVACGYADGYPRVAPSGTPVAVDGKLTCVIGRVSMDMLMVDLTDLPETGLGSRVELWGDQVSVNEVARRAGTIAYELLCNVKRVRFVYTDTPTEEKL
ncbi:alanine racemase [Sulfuriferula nivalis]|uniref:Alanine racemase n=1 Tax=Sulfuriferula nivalis TaxID=2675298 RepID=A0A809RFF0_9PROT|nr:alanine racemase [Sulfuriferula nivalis]BBO99603.1 alanine racemase [Sulfuriferula nivalis]